MRSTTINFSDDGDDIIGDTNTKISVNSNTLLECIQINIYKYSCNRVTSNFSKAGNFEVGSIEVFRFFKF